MTFHLNRHRGKPRPPQKHRDPQNPVFESRSAKVIIRGTAQELVARYRQFVEEARFANDRVACEAFLQAAEHYVRISNPASQEDCLKRERSLKRAPIVPKAQTAGEDKNKQSDEPVAPGDTQEGTNPDLIRLDEAHTRLVAERRAKAEIAEERAAAVAHLERIARQHGYTLAQLGLMLRPA